MEMNKGYSPVDVKIMVKEVGGTIEAAAKEQQEFHSPRTTRRLLDNLNDNDASKGLNSKI